MILLRHILLGLCLALLVSCDKGYEIRFSNYYPRTMDTVNIGEGKVLFTNVGSLQSTEFKKISKGKYRVVCIAADGKRIETMLEIPSAGTGKRTLQVDGISQVAVLEE